MDNKKNTVFLTIIAVATLLVTLAGATFAYFSAQGNDKETTEVKVKTGTSASTSFTITNGLSIVANQNNFTEGKPSLVASTTGSASWMAPGSSGTYNPSIEEKTMCYTVALSVTKNDFEEDPSAEETKKPAELLFNVFKKAYNSTDYTEIKNDIDGVEYNTVTGRATSLADNATTAESVTLSGYNITTLGNKATEEEPVIIYVPGDDKEKHKMYAEAGKSVTDNWQASITLVNLDTKQNYNTEKEFAAKLIFAKVDC